MNKKDCYNDTSLPETMFASCIHSNSNYIRNLNIHFIKISKE